MGKKEYRPTSGKEAREKLNGIGYLIFCDDNGNFSIFGILVAMAEEIEELRQKIHDLTPGSGGIQQDEKH